MIDAITQKPFEVEYAKDVAPVVRVPVAQLEQIQRVLDEKRFRYWVSEYRLSVNGGPETTRIQFSHSVDPTALQSALNEAN